MVSSAENGNDGPQLLAVVVVVVVVVIEIVVVATVVVVVGHSVRATYTTRPSLHSTNPFIVVRPKSKIRESPLSTNPPI